jgi:hypothetical protein
LFNINISNPNKAKMQFTNATTTLVTLASAVGSHAVDLSLAKPAPCTDSIVVLAHFTNGPTSTVFTRTVTSTAYFNCGTCQALAVQTIGGIGPVVIYNATVTATKPTTATTRVCSPTPTGT